jgi:ribosomal-protein-alanine N-acetyltransferase
MNADTFVIERATSDEDVDDVAALEAASFTNPWTRQMLAEELSRNEFARLYVLRLPDVRVAGFCACWIVTDELHINTIAVAAEHRGQGLGSALMRHIMRDVAGQGVTRATLEVRESNRPARQLYERLGFVAAGIRHGYYTEPVEDALILWRELGKSS